MTSEIQHVGVIGMRWGVRKRMSEHQAEKDYRNNLKTAMRGKGGKLYATSVSKTKTGKTSIGFGPPKRALKNKEFKAQLDKLKRKGGDKLTSDDYEGLLRSYDKAIKANPIMKKKVSSIKETEHTRNTRLLIGSLIAGAPGYGIAALVNRKKRGNAKITEGERKRRTRLAVGTVIAGAPGYGIAAWINHVKRSKEGR